MGGAAIAFCPHLALLACCVRAPQTAVETLWALTVFAQRMPARWLMWAQTGATSVALVDVVESRRSVLSQVLEVRGLNLRPWLVSRPLRVAAYTRLLGLAGLAEESDGQPLAVAVEEWMATADNPQAVDRINLSVLPLAAAVDELGPARQAAVVHACGGDPALIAALPPVLRPWAAVLLFVGTQPFALACDLAALAHTVLAGHARSYVTSTPSPPVVQASGIQTVAIWRTTLASVALLAEAYEISSIQTPTDTSAWPVAAAAALVSDEALFDALERFRRGGVGAGVGAATQSSDEAAVARGFYAAVAPVLTVRPSESPPWTLARTSNTPQAPAAGSARTTGSPAASAAARRGRPPGVQSPRPQQQQMPQSRGDARNLYGVLYNHSPED